MRLATFIAVAAVVALLIAGAVGVYAYDQGREDEIAEGVTRRRRRRRRPGPRRRRARKLRARAARAAAAPVVVRARGKTLSADRATRRGSRADVDAMVDEAIAAGRDGNVLARTRRAA